MSNDSSYQSYGENATVKLSEADPVQCCLKGRFNQCPGNPSRFQVGLCENYMAQRCARGWDQYCDLYLTEKDGDDFTGKAANKFLRDAALAKFCRNDTTAPGSYCFTKCDSFNPVGTTSAQVCNTWGDIVFRDTNELYNIDTNYNWSGKLNVPSPIKFSGCKKVCDVFNLADFTDDDRVINECLTRGACQDVMVNIAENAISTGQSVKNSRLKDFIARLVVSTKGETTPAQSSLGASPQITTAPVTVPAVSPTIIPGSGQSIAMPTAVDVAANPTIVGNNPSANIASTSASAAAEHFRTGKSEDFNYNRRRDDPGMMSKLSAMLPTNSTITVLIVALVIIIIVMIICSK